MNNIKNIFKTKVFKLKFNNILNKYKSKKKIIFLTIFLNIFFFFFYTLNLLLFPSLLPDEGHFSNPAIDLIKNGKFRTTLYRGFLKLEVFTFWEPPFYILLLALSFLIFGVSIESGRMVSVILGIIGNNIIYRACRHYCNDTKAILFSLLSGTFPLYFIQSRMIRPDIAVSAFTILSFYIMIKYYEIKETNPKSNFNLILIGIFSALSLLSHANGLITIIINAICILFRNIPFRLKTIFSKTFLEEIRRQFKSIFIFSLVIFLIFLPYLILIILMFDAFYLQYTAITGATFSDLLNNISTENLRFYAIIVDYSYFSYIGILPMFLQIIILVFMVFMFILGFISICYSSIKKDIKESKILLIYIVGILLILTIIVENKTGAYICIFSPYLFLSVSSFFKFKNGLISKINSLTLKNLILIRSLKLLTKKSFPIIKILFISLFITSHCSILVSFYTFNNNQNPYYVQEILENHNISKKEVLVGDVILYLPLEDYNFLYYMSLYTKFEEEEKTFEQLVDDFDAKIFLYCARWRSENRADQELYREFLNQTETFFKLNCTLLERFYSTFESNDPIYLYVLKE